MRFLSKICAQIIVVVTAVMVNFFVADSGAPRENWRDRNVELGPFRQTELNTPPSTPVNLSIDRPGTLDLDQFSRMRINDPPAVNFEYNPPSTTSWRTYEPPAANPPAPLPIDPPPPIKPRAEILTWPAYEHATTIIQNVKGRTAWNPFYRQTYVYLARKGFEPNPAVVKFSPVESIRLRKFLDHILQQISKCQSRFQLIEFFKNNEGRALETIDTNDRHTFWKNPDMQMFHLSLRLTYNTQYGD